MIFAILTCLSLVLLGLSWFLYRRNMELFLCLLIAVYSEFFYVLPKFVGYKYLLLPILFILLFVEHLGKRLSVGRYGWWLIGFFSISLLGIVVALFSGQGIMYGVKAAKFIPLALVYYIFARRTIDVGRFAAYFTLMALFIAVLATVTSVTYGAIDFFPGLPKDTLVEQIGRWRITAGQFVISAAAVIAFARYRQHAGIWYLVASIFLMAEVTLVQQTRGFIVGVFLSLVVVFILSRRLTMARAGLYVMLVGVVFAAAMILSTVDLSGIGFVKRIQNDISKRGGSYGGSLQARLNAYDYYWKQIEMQPVVGQGLLNFNWEGNQERYMQRYYDIHLSDIGIVHFLVQAGLIGLIWLLYGLCRLWKDLFVYREQLSIGCYFIIGTFTLPTLDMFLREDSFFLFAVFLGLSSNIIMTAHRVVTETSAV